MRAGKVQVVALSYLTCWINMCPVLVSISVGYPLCGHLHNFLIFTRVPTGIKIK